MKVIRVYMSAEEFSNYIRDRLPPEDIEGLDDCVFVPVKIGLNDMDFSIEALVVAAKDGDAAPLRYKVLDNDDQCQQLRIDFEAGTCI